MRRPHTLLAALLLAAGTAAAQDYGQAATLKIWDNTTAPHSNGIATPEREPEPMPYACWHKAKKKRKFRL